MPTSGRLTICPRSSSSQPAIASRSTPTRRSFTAGIRTSANSSAVMQGSLLKTSLTTSTRSTMPRRSGIFSPSRQASTRRSSASMRSSARSVRHGSVRPNTAPSDRRSGRCSVTPSRPGNERGPTRRSGVASPRSVKLLLLLPRRPWAGFVGVPCWCSGPVKWPKARSSLWRRLGPRTSSSRTAPGNGPWILLEPAAALRFRLTRSEARSSPSTCSSPLPGPRISSLNGARSQISSASATAGSC